MNALDHVVVRVAKHEDDDGGGEKCPTSSPHPMTRKPKRYCCFKSIELISAICIPIIIALYTILDNHSNYLIANANRENDLEIAEQNRQKDHQLAKDQQMENILIAYQDFLGKIILETKESLRKEPKAVVVLRFKTLTALEQLDARRRNIVIRSLYDAELITNLISIHYSIEELGALNLRQIHLKDLTLGSDRDLPAFPPWEQRISWSYLSLPLSTFTNVSFRHGILDCAYFDSAHMYLVDLSFTQTTYRKQCSNSTDDNGSVFLTHTQLVNTSIYYVSWYHAILSSATLTSVDMRKSHCFECQFVQTKLNQVDLSSAVFTRYAHTVNRSDFRRISMNQVTAYKTKFQSIDFTESSWMNTQAGNAEFSDCIFASVVFHNSSFAEGIFKQSEFQNLEAYSIDFNHAKFSHIIFSNSTMDDINFSYFTCVYCTFINVTFENIIWTNATIRYSYFLNCHIQYNQLINDALDLTETSLLNETTNSTNDKHFLRLKKVKYFIRIKTRESFLTKNTTHFYLMMLGTNINTDLFEVQSAYSQLAFYDPQQIDHFIFENYHIGNITSIKWSLIYDLSALTWITRNRLLLDWIEIEVPIDDMIYRFNCTRWCWYNQTKTQSTFVEISAPTEIIRRTNIILYKITIVTGDELGAGTDDNVYIIIFGEHNKTEKISLIESKSSKNPFEKGQIDVFEIEALNIVKPINIRIGLETTSSLYSSWLLSHVNIYIPKFDQTWSFPCDKWLDKSRKEYEL